MWLHQEQIWPLVHSPSPTAPSQGHSPRSLPCCTVGRTPRTTARGAVSEAAARQLLLWGTAIACRPVPSIC